MSELKALIVDDEKSLRNILSILLSEFGFSCEEAESVSEALSKVSKEDYDLVLLDLRLKDASGMEVLRFLRENSKSSEVIIITAFATSETADEAVRLGAFDYITKPFEISELRLILRNVKRKIELEKKVGEYEDIYKDFVGVSPSIRKIKEVVRKIAPYDASVLILGESGSGKEVVARMIHRLSRRKNKPFVAINCASLPSELLESELFGYKKGAFTGAVSDKKGLIEEADGGTLFLDEIGDMPLSLQAKLLRFLEDRKIRPIGSLEEKEVDVRVIAATNKRLEDEIKKGSFREDLYYRLATITIEIPPLRERKEDIPVLVKYFADRLSKKYRKAFTKISPKLINYLTQLELKGNVRELKNIVERAVIMSDGETLELPELIEPSGSARIFLPKEGLDLKKTLSDIEKDLIKQALEKSGGKKTEAAKLLKLSLREFRYRYSKYFGEGSS